MAIHPLLPTLGVVSQPLTHTDGPSFRAGPLYTLRMDLSLISNWTIQPMHPQGPEGIDRKRGPKDTVPANGSFITGAWAAMSEKREPRPKHWLGNGCTVGPKAPGLLGQGALQPTLCDMGEHAGCIPGRTVHCVKT